MTSGYEQILTAALVHKLGGDVTITQHELNQARDLELTGSFNDATMSCRYTAKIPTPPKTIAEVLEAHPDWTTWGEADVVGCEGCDWKQVAGRNDKAADMFRQHQTDMIEAEGFRR